LIELNATLNAQLSTLNIQGYETWLARNLSRKTRNAGIPMKSRLAVSNPAIQSYRRNQHESKKEFEKGAITGQHDLRI
jgi:hypothetical protein